MLLESLNIPLSSVLFTILSEAAFTALDHNNYNNTMNTSTNYVQKKKKKKQIKQLFYFLQYPIFYILSCFIVCNLFDAT